MRIREKVSFYQGKPEVIKVGNLQRAVCQSCLQSQGKIAMIGKTIHKATSTCSSWHLLSQINVLIAHDVLIWIYTMYIYSDTTVIYLQVISLFSRLLFISYKLVKGFLAITVLLLAFLELKLPWCVSTYFILPETKFQLDPTKNEKFPQRPHL